MKKIAIMVLLALELTVGGCGSSQTTAAADASGAWQAVLTGGAGEASVLSFNTTFSVNNNGSISVSSLQFFSAGTCFVSETGGGTATLTTDTNGLVTGDVTFVVNSTTPAGNTLTLTGTESGSTITGTWTLVGSEECSGGGDFTMKKS